MYFKSLDYPVIVIDNDYESPRIGGILIRALVEELRSNDQRVLCGLNLDDARAGARTYVAASAVLISIDGSEEVDGEFQRLTAFLREQSARRANLPVFLYGERRTIEKVPSKLLKYIHGFIFLFGAAIYRGHWRFAFARYFRTREFHGQKETPVYGTLTIGRRF